MKAYKTAQGNWQVNFSINGKQKTISLGSSFGAANAERAAKEYARVLKDDARLLELVRSGADEDDLFSMPTDELLALRDSLVRRFGTGKIAS